MSAGGAGRQSGGSRDEAAAAETSAGPLRRVIAPGLAASPELQGALEGIDAEIRSRLGMPAECVAAGVVDLMGMRTATLHPDRFFYAASIAKIAILLAWFTDRPDVAQTNAEMRRELGLMMKASCNRMATRYSRRIGLQRIQEVLNAGGYYSVREGGGLWLGKHYGENDERYGDPVADHSAGATVRQVLRFFVALGQERLVSPEVSRTMRQIFASPDIPHDDFKFVRGLRGRGLEILRKWGTWEDWRHDAAMVAGAGRRYVLAGLTHHPRGDDYLEALAAAVDDVLSASAGRSAAG